MMRRFAVVAALVAGLGLAACGGDDDDAGGGGSQDDVFDMMMQAMEESLASEMPEGVELDIEDIVDEDCLRDKTDQLSDEDAEKIVEAGIDGDPEVSAEAEQVAESLDECFDAEAIADAITESSGG
jgi:hypothetical protein